jgi:photosystem II stability/assembly factor-like uncharacterized protein
MSKMNLILKTLVAMVGVILMCEPATAGDIAKTISSQGIRENIYSSAIISGDEVIIVCDNGKIYLSGDRGNKWIRVDSRTNQPLYSVCFPDKKNGWIAGRAGTILHTTDGGKSWVKQKSGINKHLFGIHFSDALHGCAVGDWGAVVVTEDGGQNWKDVHLQDDIVLYAVQMTQKGGIIVGEFGSILRSGDNGHTWTAQTPVVEQSLFCLSENNGKLIAGGLEGVIIYSDDNGAKWSRSLNSVNHSIYGIDLLGNTGYAVGDRGTILLTKDGGKTWEHLKVPLQIELFWLSAVSISSEGGSPGGLGTGANGITFKLNDKQISW